MVLMLEPGTGEALEIPCTIKSFHDRELIENRDAALAATPSPASGPSPNSAQSSEDGQERPFNRPMKMASVCCLRDTPRQHRGSGVAVLLNSLPREPATHSSAGPSNKKLVHLPLMYINLPIASEVPLVAPADSCCNCGSISKISPMATDLRRMPLMGLAGTEITVVLPFPYCDVCAVTARRRRPSPLGVMAITCLLSLCFGMLPGFRDGHCDDKYRSRGPRSGGGSPGVEQIRL